MKKNYFFWITRIKFFIRCRIRKAKERYRLKNIMVFPFDMIRRWKIKRVFHIFFSDVDVKDSDSIEVFVHCSRFHLVNSYMDEAVFKDGLATDVERASAVSHFVHAFLHRKYGASVEIPTPTPDGFTFYVCGAYRNRKGGVI